MLINALCEICSSTYFPNLTASQRLTLLKTLHNCLDDYFFFRYLYPEEAPKILEAQRIKYQEILKQLECLYQNPANSTAGQYEILSIQEALKALTTEKGFLEQTAADAKQSLADASSLPSVAFGCVKLILKTISGMHQFWYANIWAIRNFARLLVDHPNAAEFQQFIAYARDALTKNTGDWQIGFAVGEALTEIINNCQVEELRVLAMHNAAERLAVLPVIPESATESKAATVTELKTTQVTTQPQEAKQSATSAATTVLATPMVSADRKDLKDVKETKQQQPVNTTPLFYVDLEFLLAQCQKRSSERYPAFSDDRSLYSAVEGMLIMCAAPDQTSWTYYFAEEARKNILALQPDTRSWRELLTFTNAPFLRQRLNQYSRERQAQSQTDAKTATKSEPLNLSATVPFTVITQPLELKTTSEISSRLNLAAKSSGSDLTRFTQTVEDLREMFLKQPQNFTQDETLAFFTTVHLLARVYLASHRPELAAKLYNSFTAISADLLRATSFYQHAGDNYFMLAVATGGDYFTNDLYAQALAYYSQAAKLQTTTDLQQRLQCLQAAIDYRHVSASLQQELLAYQTRATGTLPLMAIMQRIRPLATRLKELGLKKELAALYGLLAPAITTLVASFINQDRQRIKTPTTEEQQLIATLGQHLWFHEQYALAEAVYGIDVTTYAALQSSCREQKACTLDCREFKASSSISRTNLTEVKAENLAAAVQATITGVCQEVVATLGQPVEQRFDIVAFGPLSQGTLQLQDRINLAILLGNPVTRFGNYLRDVLALSKIRLELNLAPHFVFNHLQYPVCLTFMQTPEELLSYCTATTASEKPLLLSEEARYQLLRPTVVYSNTNDALSTAYRQQVFANAAHNKRVAAAAMEVHSRNDTTKLAFLEHTLSDLALYYGIQESNILKIIAALKTNQVFTPEFINQLELEAKALLAGNPTGYLIAALPGIANIWTQGLAPVPASPFDPMLAGWDFVTKNAELNQEMVVAFGEYLVRNLHCVDIATHLKHFKQVPPELKPQYYAILERAFGAMANEQQATGKAILKVLAEQPDEYGNRISTAIQQQAFTRVLHSALTTEFKDDKEHKKDEAQVLIEWMEGPQKTTRLLRPEVARQLFANNGMPNSSKKTTYGKRIVIPITGESKQELAYCKFYPERPGVQLQVDALARRIAGFALNWKLCRLTVVQGSKKVSYPVMLSEPAGLSLQDICSGKDSRLNFDALCKQLDPRSFSLLMLTRMIIDPEDDQLANFVAQSCLNHELKETYRLVCVDSDHAFDDALVREHGKIKVNLKSYLFCMNEMLQALDPTAVQEFCSLKVYSLLLLWLKEVQEYDQLHIMRQQTGLFSLAGGSTSEVATYLNPTTTAFESKADQAIASTYLPSMFRVGMVQGVFQRLIHLQEILRTNPQLTHFALLQRMNKDLAAYYGTALAEAKEMPWDRFKRLPHNYVTVRLATTTPTTALTEVRSVRSNPDLFPQIASTVVINQREAVTMQQLFTEFAREDYPKQLQARVDSELARIFELYQGDAARFAILSGDAALLKKLDPHAREYTINRIDFSTVNADLAVQILKNMQGVGYATLKLAGSAALTDSLLAAILKSSQGTILNLNLSNCSQLTAKSLENIALYCPHLKTLNLNGTAIEFIGDRSFLGTINPVVLPELEELRAANCPRLAQLNLTAPKMQRCTFANSTHLATLACNPPSMLRLLDLQGCTQIQHREFLEKYPFLAVGDLNTYTAAAIKAVDERVGKILMGLDWHSCSAEVLNNLSKVFAEYLAETEKVLHGLLKLPLNVGIIEALRNLGRTDKSLINKLLAALNDESSVIQVTAAEALVTLGRISPEVIAVLLQALANEDNEVRHTSALTLGALGQKSPEVITALTNALGNKQNIWLRLGAAEALGISGKLISEAITTAIAALDNESENVRKTALEILGKIGNGSSEIASIFLRAMKDPAIIVRQTATEELGKINPVTTEILAALMHTVQDETEDYGVRQAAAISLGNVGKEKPEITATLLHTLGNDENPEARALAAITLGTMGKRSSEIIEALMHTIKEFENSAWPNEPNEKDHRVPIEVAIALANLGQESTEITNRLFGCLGYIKAGGVSKRAAKALQTIGRMNLRSDKEISEENAAFIHTSGLDYSSYLQLEKMYQEVFRGLRIIINLFAFLSADSNTRKYVADVLEKIDKISRISKTYEPLLGSQDNESNKDILLAIALPNIRLNGFTQDAVTALKPFAKTSSAEQKEVTDQKAQLQVVPEDKKSSQVDSKSAKSSESPTADPTTDPELERALMASLVSNANKSTVTTHAAANSVSTSLLLVSSAPASNFGSHSEFATTTASLLGSNPSRSTLFATAPIPTTGQLNLPSSTDAATSHSASSNDSKPKTVIT